jgi:hypothetical protein
VRRPQPDVPEILMPDKEYYSFEEVLKDLKLEENELKRLVSAGEIRAFRDKNTMRFKAEDIARLRESPNDPQDVQLDDLELDLDDTTAAPAQPAAEVEELVLEETVIEETPAGVEELDLSAEPEAPVRERGRGRERPATRRAPAEVTTAVVVEEEPATSPLVVGALIVGVVLLILANFVILDAVTGKATGLSGAVAGVFG